MNTTTTIAEKSRSDRKINTLAKRKKIDKENRQILLDVIEKTGLTRSEIAEATGYSIETIRAYTMPDRTSLRAKHVTDRFIRLLTTDVPAYLSRRKPS